MREKELNILFPSSGDGSIFPHRGMAVAFCEARNEADAECERTSVDKEKKN